MNEIIDAIKRGLDVILTQINCAQNQQRHSPLTLQTVDLSGRDQTERFQDGDSDLLIQSDGGGGGWTLLLGTAGVVCLVTEQG